MNDRKYKEEIFFLKEEASRLRNQLWRANKNYDTLNTLRKSERRHVDSTIAKLKQEIHDLKEKLSNKQIQHSNALHYLQKRSREYDEFYHKLLALLPG